MQSAGLIPLGTTGFNLWLPRQRQKLEVLRPIHAKPVNEKDYAAGEYALYRNAKREGIPA